MNSRPMRKNQLLSLSLMLVLCSTSFAQSLQTTGRIEGRIGLIPSMQDDSQNMVHMERIHFGLQQEFDFLSMNYEISGGGIAQGSSDLGGSRLLPEYHAQAQFVPVGRMKIELFSYSQLRNPMQIARDTLIQHEQVNGLQIESPLPGAGRILAGFGSRSASRDDSTIANQFYKLQLEQKLLGMRIRLRGEKDVFSKGVADRDEDRSNLALQWYGSPLKNLSWTSVNSVYSYAGNQYWRIYQRLNYKLSEKSTIWSHVRNQQAAYNGTYLNTQSFDLDFRRKLGTHFVGQIVTEGRKVKPLEGDPLYHWRAYSAGVHWRFGEERSAVGLFQTGFKESYRFGSGLNLRFELEERLPLLQNRLLSLRLSDYAAGEYFIRMDDDQGDPKYDMDHEVRLNLDLFPGRRVQLANTFKLMNHLGADLDFSTDTLRNAITHNIQLKYTQRKLRASLDHLTINELGDNKDTRLHLNTRASYQLASGRSLNWHSMYRYQSELYPDYLWLNAFVKINLKYFNWALEVQAQGAPDKVLDENLSVWMRFVRQL